MMKILKYNLLLLTALILVSGCRKLLDLPEEKDYLSGKLNYSNKVFEPVLGRTTVMGTLNADNSTLPMQFEIVNARYGDGRPYDDMFKVHKTWVWTSAYTGKETSLEQINAKRKLEDHPMFEIRSSGQFIMWQSSTDELIDPRPADSSNRVQDMRLFDLKVKNSGGEVLLRDFQIRPWRERSYEPSTDINPYTGAVARDPKDPNNPNKRDYILADIGNIIGTSSDLPLISNADQKDVVVYIRPFTGGNGHSLRFKFLDKDEQVIDPAKFNETKWEQLVHGFNMQQTTTYVQYDVAYPIPLVNISTPYAPNGSQASSYIKYSRRGFGGIKTTAYLGLTYNIFKAGDWEIVFHFRRENPKFQDE
ncbi:DUF5007 domain-containing protein [Pedobacter sp. B4-66]|uniref:DUF5007 domain-containing protein n=1 Tax=Pedobacter sp. B4-66 TaxID=2817280 RepID=UPI001BD9D0B3|nr:DUF5007 domain-containing protein [Pedobacter sp. B4-66]